MSYIFFISIVFNALKLSFYFFSGNHWGCTIKKSRGTKDQTIYNQASSSELEKNKPKTKKFFI